MPVTASFTANVVIMKFNTKECQKKADTLNILINKTLNVKNIHI